MGGCDGCSGDVVMGEVVMGEVVMVAGVMWCSGASVHCKSASHKKGKRNSGRLISNHNMIT